MAVTRSAQSLCFGRNKYFRLILEMLSFGLSLNQRVFLLVFTCRILIFLCFINLKVKKYVWNSMYLYLVSKIYCVRGAWLTCRFWCAETVDCIMRAINKNPSLFNLCSGQDYYRCGVYFACLYSQSKNVIGCIYKWVKYIHISRTGSFLLGPCGTSVDHAFGP